LNDVSQILQRPIRVTHGLVSMDHLEETIHCESYGHVIDDVMTPKYLRLNISKPYKIQGWRQWGTNRKPPTAGLMVT